MMKLSYHFEIWEAAEQQSDSKIENLNLQQCRMYKECNEQSELFIL